MITKIISGGQTGADQGGLEAGRLLGLETGGTAPYNWMTEDGPRQELLESYELVAGPYDLKTYPLRTVLNVESSDGTVWFGNPYSPGGRLTMNTATKEQKPYLINPDPEGLSDWIEQNAIGVLNVAGNRESKNPGISARTIAVIQGALLVRQSRADS